MQQVIRDIHFAAESNLAEVLHQLKREMANLTKCNMTEVTSISSRSFVTFICSRLVVHVRSTTPSWSAVGGSETYQSRLDEATFQCLYPVLVSVRSLRNLPIKIGRSNLHECMSHHSNCESRTKQDTYVFQRGDTPQTTVGSQR